MTKNKKDLKDSIVEIPNTKFIKFVRLQKFRLSDSTVGQWESIVEKKDVNVLFLGLTKKKKIIVIKVFRPPVNSVCIELPGGILEAGEDLQTGALREFTEETGYKPSVVRFLCRGYLWNAKSNQKFEVWVGLNCKKVQPRKLDSFEKLLGLKVDTLSISKIQKKLRKGDLSIDPVLTHALFTLGTI